MKPPSSLDLPPRVESEFEAKRGAAEKGSSQSSFLRLHKLMNRVVLLLLVYLTEETQGELFRGTNRHVATVVGAQDESCEESKIHPKKLVQLHSEAAGGEGKARPEERERNS